jgi:hypothetical protein
MSAGEAAGVTSTGFMASLARCHAGLRPIRLRPPADAVDVTGGGARLTPITAETHVTDPDALGERYKKHVKVDKAGG